jgi:hypothetical protein
MSQLVEGFRASFPHVSAADREFASYVSQHDVELIVAKLADSSYSGLGKACYVLGTGAQPRSIYSHMEGLSGIHVVAYESPLPRGLRWLPSYRGLVRVDDPSRLCVVFDELTGQSTAVIYIFDVSLEAAFVDAARHKGAHRDCSFGVKQDPGYLIYLVDADRDDSPTGMVEFLSYGWSGPWKRIIGESRPAD